MSEIESDTDSDYEEYCGAGSIIKGIVIPSWVTGDMLQGAFTNSLNSAACTIDIPTFTSSPDIPPDYTAFVLSTNVCYSVLFPHFKTFSRKPSSRAYRLAIYLPTVCKRLGIAQSAVACGFLNAIDCDGGVYMDDMDKFACIVCSPGIPFVATFKLGVDIDYNA